MVEKKRPSPQDMAERALEHARAAVKRGNRANADHWIKTADNLARVAERVAAEKTANPPPNVEEIREELRRRVGAVCQMTRDNSAWERKHDIREAVAAFARAHNLPEPPPVEAPEPYSEWQMEVAGKGDYWPLPRVDMMAAWEREEREEKERAENGRDTSHTS